MIRSHNRGRPCLRAVLTVVLLTGSTSMTSEALAGHTVPTGPPTGTTLAPPATAAPPATEVPPPPQEPAPGSPGPPAKPPKQAVSPAGRIVYLDLSGAVNVPLKCKRSGSMRLSRSDGLVLGSTRFDCDRSVYRTVATVAPGASAERALRRRLGTRSAVKLRARFKVGSKRSSARLKLREAVARSERGSPQRSGDVWINGYLSCGRPNLLSQPHLQMFHAGVSAQGNLATGFYNDTPGDNWIWYRPYLYFYDHGWWAGEWRGPVYVPPYNTIVGVGAGDVLGDPAQGQNSYVAGVSYVWWYNGIRDWNWVVADSPLFGYPVTASYYCHIA